MQKILVSSKTYDMRPTAHWHRPISLHLVDKHVTLTPQLTDKNIEKVAD